MKKRIQFNSLKAWREAHELSQREAAGQFGVSQGAWNKIELGLRTPRKALLAKLAHGTGVPVEVLTGIAS